MRISRTNVETHYPNVFLSINKNRLKVYNGNSVFLNHGDEFELEFDNTTRETWLAKIKLNGEFVSDAGLVLRPGERVFLNTPDLDSYNKNRFRFETYEIESGRSHLIQDNGRVEIFFHKKQMSASVKYRYDVTFTPNSFSNSPNSFSNYCTDTGGSVKEETGRVEKGSKSIQEFVDVNESFESYWSHVVEYHILPVTKKPKTIQEVKEYCSACGYRRRKGQNFCPRCGRKF